MTWEADLHILVKIHPRSFAQGAMRGCYRMKKWNPAHLLQKTPTHKDWHKASPYVAKRYLDQAIVDADVDGRIYKEQQVRPPVQRTRPAQAGRLYPRLARTAHRPPRATVLCGGAVY
jgi:hypothetical protein